MIAQSKKLLYLCRKFVIDFVELRFVIFNS